ncbi:MAG: DUF87 domain-containing protein, partial [Alphaproteobacteria bacterium]|nr:DUF87 domain-containing protein [Alphaproteobacteria bacterium]
MAGLPVLSLAAAALSIPFLTIAIGFRPRDLLGPVRLTLAMARLVASGALMVGRLLVPARRQAPEIDDEDEPPRRRRGRAAIEPAPEEEEDDAPRRRLPRMFFGLFARRGERVEPSLFDRPDQNDDERGLIEPRLDDEDLDDRPAPRKPERLVAPKAARTQPGKRAEAQRQRRLDLGDDSGFRLPALDLLSTPPAPSRGPTVSEEALQQNARLLETVLKDFGINGQIVKVRPGPVVTMYELEPAPGIKTSRVIGLADDIARSMSAVSVRAAVVPGQSTIGVELPNAKRDIVYLRELLASDAYERNGGKLPLVLGKDIGGAPVIVDLARMPHLLVAGTTGSGKSVAVNAMILSLLYRLPPDQCRFIMIDPKMLELSVYDGIPHLLSPVVTEPRKAVVALKWTVREMENRYRNMAKLGVRNIEGYNARLAE